MRRPLIALRGGADAIVLALAWVEQTKLRVTVLASGAITSEETEAAIETARGVTAIDDDPTEFLRMVKDHEILGPLAQHSAPRLGRAPTVFETVAVGIIEQLVTGEEARNAIRRLWRIAGEPVPGSELVAPPLPAAVRRVPMWQMHSIGIGSRRATTLREAAGRGPAIERLREHSPEVFLEKIQSIHGIGPWTANQVARQALGWSDAVPVGDFHGPFTISARLAGRTDLSRDNMDEANAVMLEALEPFRPHRARVALLLEREQIGTYRLPRVDPHRREPWRY